MHFKSITKLITIQSLVTWRRKVNLPGNLTGDEVTSYFHNNAE